MFVFVSFKSFLEIPKNTKVLASWYEADFVFLFCLFVLEIRTKIFGREHLENDSSGVQETTGTNGFAVWFILWQNLNGLQACAYGMVGVA